MIHEFIAFGDKRLRPIGRILPILSLFTSICFVLTNPYGFDLLIWIAKSLSIPRTSRITEWAPVHLYNNQLELIGFYLLAPLLLSVVFNQKKKIFFEWSLLLSLGFLGWMNNRNTVFFCLAAAMILPKYLESTFPKLTSIPKLNRTFKHTMLIISFLFAIGIHTVHGYKPTEIIVETSKHPYNAIKFMKKNNLKGNLLAYFDWSQMAMWYLNDTCKIAFDGRFRTVYPLHVINDYFQFVNVDKHWQKMLYEYDTNIVLMPENWSGAQLLIENRDWLLAYKSSNFNFSQPNRSLEKALIFVRKDMFPEFENRLAQGDLINVGQQSHFYFGETSW
jgi:hypothetical protein